MRKVRVNQIGYKTAAEKYAVFADLDEDDRTFTVVEAETDKTVFEGTITKAKPYKVSGEYNSAGFFTEVTCPGKYKIVTAKGEESYVFEIGDKIYDKTLINVFRVLYLQRCGIKLPEAYAKEFAHEACHNSPARIYGTDEKLDVNGGWHDAGDYGRYIVSGAKAVMDLFIAYEANPALFNDAMNIPESGNGVPDILDEARYELEWMFKMQDSKTGGVYHKVTGERFPGFVMPQHETWEMVVSPVSNTATADFAAIMALSSTVYKDIDTGFANKCLGAAKKAFDYVVKHQDAPGFKNPDGIVTGEYPDDNCFDEIMWAAVELYKVTEDESYADVILSAYEKVTKWTILGWDDVGGYAAYSALTSDLLKKNHLDFWTRLKSDFINQVDDMVDEAKANPYFISRTDTFEWGSNMSIADNGMILWMANKISPNQDYVIYMKYNLDYIFGINAVDYCFVTGEGSNSPVHPHHRPSAALGKPMPGMLVGGPDNGLHDETAARLLADKAPAACYIDHLDSYSTNEICVYWNSPLIALLAMC
ncbi:MAG: glycoside hydrolase family 9 protein [Pseudobutyrivibrio sp.]|nr:glycoside hydrolase family 9 protein [Pseudobutyrivibrio sp.]